MKQSWQYFFVYFNKKENTYTVDVLLFTVGINDEEIIEAYDL